MADRGSELLPKASLGQYEIKSRIGSGGMGDVYDATHTGLNRRVAIKTLRRRFLDDETIVQRFLREGQLASRIRHPNIVDVTDVGMISGLPCLVMEHLEGEPLGHVIKREGAMPVAALVDLLLPIVAAVDLAHERQVLHRDIKPSNIFLARSWNGDITPKILDFGISKLIDESQQNGLTTDSAFVGTPHYASPELMRADRSADGRSDQYSMGVVLYEAATGVKPFTEKGGNFVALAMAICAAEFPPPRKVKPDLPPAFEQLILKAMALHPDDRYPSMRALGEAMLPFASERARLLWSPTFAGASAAGPGSTRMHAATPQDGTQVMLRPNTHSTGVQAVSALGRTGPPSGYNSLPASSGTNPGGTNPSGVVSLSHQSATPPAGAYDRTPSYASGGGYFPGGPQPKKPTSVVTLMVAGFVAATLVVVVVMIAKWTKPPAATTEAPPAASTAQPAAYALALRVVPDNAAIELDGVSVGTGKLDRSLPRDGRKHVLRVSAPGYTDSFSEFDDAHPPPSSISLRPAAGATTSPPGSTKPVVHGSSSGGQAGQGGQGGKPSGKNPTDRPRTDNIDPWE